MAASSFKSSFSYHNVECIYEELNCAYVLKEMDSRLDFHTTIYLIT